MAPLRIHEPQCLCHELPDAFLRFACTVTAFRQFVLDGCSAIGGFFAIDGN